MPNFQLPNQFVCYLILFAVTGVPFYFRWWMAALQIEAKRDFNAIEFVRAIDVKTSKLTFALFALLFAFGCLVDRNTESSFAQAGFACTLLSFCFLYSFRNQKVAEVQTTTPKSRVSQQKALISNFRQSAVSLASILIAIAIGAALTPFFSAFVGYGVAILFVVYAAPLTLRFSANAQCMTDSSLREKIEAVFAKAGVSVHEIYITEHTNVKTGNAVVCGPRFGFGPFQRTLFFTESVFSLLEEDEILAVVAHEASHFQLNHLYKRTLSGAASVGICTLLFVGPFALFLTYFTQFASAAAVALVLAALAFQVSWIGRTIRKQEHEADLNALSLGANAHDLLNALEKLSPVENRKTTETFTKHILGRYHPSLEERQECLQNQAIPGKKLWFFKPAVVASYAVLMITLSVFSVSQVGKILPFRGPAASPRSN
jgi:Zn-dependent protease with chaperone function